MSHAGPFWIELLAIRANQNISLSLSLSYSLSFFLLENVLHHCLLLLICAPKFFWFSSSSSSLFPLLGLFSPFSTLYVLSDFHATFLIFFLSGFYIFSFSFLVFESTFFLLSFREATKKESQNKDQHPDKNTFLPIHWGLVHSCAFEMETKSAFVWTKVIALNFQAKMVCQFCFHYFYGAWWNIHPLLPAVVNDERRAL